MARGLYRLLAWLSPNFPTGAYSYSHGLEAAAERRAVHDRASLEAWVRAIVEHGGGRIDADVLRDAHRAAAAGDLAALTDARQRGAAYRATPELALESAQQGAAFDATRRAAWPAAAPHPNPLPASGERESDAYNRSAAFPLPIKWGEGQGEGHCCHSAAFGAAAARAGIALEDALVGYLQSLAGNLIAAGLRLGIVGQTDGQRILAALEPVIVRAAAAALSRDLRDFGSATFAADLLSIAHETQYSRLFRS
jgi:urease accessory protein